MIIIQYLISHLGEVIPNKHGTPMKVIRYINTCDMTIEFQDDNKRQVKTTYVNFKRGSIQNQYDKTIYGVGYIGEGKYQVRESKNKLNIRYNIWNSMLDRCYSDNIKQYPAYDGCTVCEEWHNYQNFAQWYEDNYYSVDDKRMHVDKDILVKNNKIYSPDTCLIVPQRINMLFINKHNIDNLPSGIRLTNSGKYHTSYNTKYLGVYENLEEAVNIHDQEKRIHIKKIVEEYKNKLPDKVKLALLNW